MAESWGPPETQGQEEKPGWGCSAPEHGENSAALTGVNEAEDAERDGNINVLNGEFLPQGAEKSIQGKLSRRVGDGKGKPDFTWTQRSSVLAQEAALPEPLFCPSSEEVFYPKRVYSQ